MATLQALINAIPDAQDGNVITSNYHNTIKRALLAIATQMGAAATGSQTVTLTVQPSFAAIAGGATPWVLGIGSAGDAGPPSTSGFIPLNFPDGAVVQTMTVIGAKTNAAPKGFVNLLIVPIGGSAGTTLIQVDLSTAGNPFSLTGTPNVPGLTASALVSMQTVQNSQFKYVIEAQVFSTTGIPPASVVINALQIGYVTAT